MAITPTQNLTKEKERGEFEELVKQIRPELHRYAARMTGSAIDGEDVVQEAVLKAFNSLGDLKSGANLRGWLFRIAHNKAIDHLRARKLQTMEQLDENIIADAQSSPLERKEATALALKVFLRLAPRQRSCVILKDVLGYSLAEISRLLDASVAEIKAVLHRGRTRLRELGKTLETGSAPVLGEREFKLLNRYVERFNARDFEAVRQMLTDETRLDLVGKAKHTGANEISRNYFHNYNRLHDWHFAPGIVENRPAILVFDPESESAAQPLYFLVLTIENDQISNIRDYRYARYVTEDAEITALQKN
jgi:RNA polymerase sigma-70 factor (ECF subfamily)